MISIVKARPKDFKGVFILLEQLFLNEKLSKFKTKNIFIEDLTSKDSMELLLKENDEIIGYASVKFRNDIQSQGRIGYLSELIIDRANRGKGLGTKFLKEIMRMSKNKGCKEIQFPSTFKRKKAHKFYESIGFHKTAYFFWIEL